MANITDKVFKVQPMIMKPIVTNCTFFTVNTSIKINYLNQFCLNTTFIRPVCLNLKTNLNHSQKDCHEDNLLLLFYTFISTIV